MIINHHYNNYYYCVLYSYTQIHHVSMYYNDSYSHVHVVWRRQTNVHAMTALAGTIRHNNNMVELYNSAEQKHNTSTNNYYRAAHTIIKVLAAE